MSDINPTLDRQAHGAGDGGFHLFHHHDRAADHHEKAAEQHAARDFLDSVGAHTTKVRAGL